MDGQMITFGTEKKGYAKAQVNAYINGLMGEYEKLLKENEASKGSVDDFTKQVAVVNENNKKLKDALEESMKQQDELQKQNEELLLEINDLREKNLALSMNDIKPVAVAKVASSSEYEEKLKELEQEKANFANEKAKAIADGYLKGEAIAEEIKEEAKREADRIITEAKIKRGEIMIEEKAAVENINKIIDSLQTALSDRNAEIQIDSIAKGA